MKKVLFFICVGLFSSTLWLLEPLSLNPFYQAKKTQIQSQLSYHCEPDNLSRQAEFKANADSTLKQFLSASKFLGVSAGVYSQKCGSYVSAAGYKDKRDRLTFDLDTVTRIASLTKPMTAVAIMQLYEQGLINLDAPINTYLPKLPQYEKKITVRHLLSHTSGIPHYSSKWDAMSFTHFSSLNKSVDSIIQRGITGQPGKQYIYSSFGYTILGQVIESVSGLQFDEYLNKNIWRKASMHNTALEVNQTHINKSRLYIKAGPLYIRSPYTDLSIIHPAGGVQSTAQDLLHFGEAILANKLITRETLELMIDVTDSLAPMAGDDPYGMGWSVYYSEQNGRVIAHGGAQPGVSAHFQIWLDKGVVSVVLSNAFGTKGSAHAFANSMGELAL